MGHVDLVVRQDGRFARLFAQKRLRAHLIDDPAVRRMFLDEGRIAGLVRHPHVVSVVDVGEDHSGPYLVMDFVEGVSLAELVARPAARRQQVPMSVALRIAVQVADGLHAVHETRGPDGELLQLIHRDVSPQNVLIAFDGTARVSDFGIAKALGRATRTTTGVLKGKVGYLAPERLRFEEPDRRADLFSYGVVLFELLAGRRLYDGADDSEAARRILNEPPPDLVDERDDAPPELVELVFELLAKNRDCRPADAATVARRLERMLAVTLATDDSMDVGAYVGRLFAEERNALRARIAQVTQEAAPAAKRPLRGPGRLAWGALAGASGLVAVLAIAAGPRTTPAPGPVSDAAAQVATAAQVTPPAVASELVPTPVASSSPPTHKRRSARIARASAGRPDRRLEGCDPPYTLNAAGERQFKLRCLVDVRR
jgi:serine/threonine-protein kinase